MSGLREAADALEPFAEAADFFDDEEHAGIEVSINVDIAHLHRARAVFLNLTAKELSNPDTRQKAIEALENACALEWVSRSKEREARSLIQEAIRLMRRIPIAAEPDQPAPIAEAVKWEEEIGWLIEIDGPTYYGEQDDGIVGWTGDQALAIRFARREDAARMIRLEGFTEAKAIEHMWMDHSKKEEEDLQHGASSLDYTGNDPGDNSFLPPAPTSGDGERVERVVDAMKRELAAYAEQTMGDYKEHPDGTVRLEFDFFDLKEFARAALGTIRALPAQDRHQSE